MKTIAISTQQHNGILQIELAVDTVDAAEFAAWLRYRGHDVTIGKSTGSYINGVWTSTDDNADNTMRKLWDEFCSRQDA